MGASMSKLRSSPPPFRILRTALLSLSALLSIAVPARSETVSPSVHWGAIAYPDRDDTLTAGLVLNRFTEFDGERHRYNSTIKETMGFNMIALSWTEHWKRFEGWSTNLTFGIGPTGDQPTRFLQNDVIHKIRGFAPVPVDASRDQTDFMVDASLTRWANILGTHKTGFFGIGGSTGSLYQEPWARIGVRRFSLAESIATLSGSAPGGVFKALEYVRFSAMGRYSRPYGGAAFQGFNAVAPQTYLGQASVSVGNYDKENKPIWEVEIALTVDSGLFVDFKGNSQEERFGSLLIRVPYVTFETWNDLINSKDRGPTFGASLTLDLLQLRDRFYGPS